MAFMAMAMLVGVALAGFIPGDEAPEDGNAEDERYDGTEDDERFDAAGGNDLVHGQGGDDTLLGGDGNDWIIGAGGQDVLLGGNGEDVIVGGSGGDMIEAGAGDDFVEAANIIDEGRLDASAREAESFSDIAFAYDLPGSSDAGDVIDLGAGEDTVVLGSDDSLTGGEGADQITLGDWIEPGRPAVIDDYDAAEDLLVITYDSERAEPVISIISNENGDAALIEADGVTMAVLSGLSPDQVTSEIRLVSY